MVDIQGNSQNIKPDEARSDGGQVERLLALMSERIGLFVSPDGTSWATVDMPGRREVHPVTSKEIKHLMSAEYFEETESAPRPDSLSHAVLTLEARARSQNINSPVQVRTGERDGKLYLDLCDERWRAVEVDSTGWRVLPRSPIHFRRSRGMLPIPAPEPGGKIDELRSFLNVKNEGDFALLIAWLLGAMKAVGPFPILALTGEPGSAKSTTAKMLRTLIDPNFSSLRTGHCERDLWIAASNSGVVVLDNLSSIQPWLSDALCRIATGGGYSARKLQTDAGEHLINVARPVILTSVGEIISQPDLADRAIMIDLPEIGSGDRRDEDAMWKAFETARPRILAGLLDAMVHGLGNRLKVTPRRLPRLADFALWASACEGAFTENGTILAALEAKAEDAVDAILEGDAVLVSIVAFLDQRGGHWKGSCERLLSLLKGSATKDGWRMGGWPANGQTLSNRIKMASPILRRLGISVSRGKSNGRRYIQLTKR